MPGDEDDFDNKGNRSPFHSTPESRRVDAYLDTVKRLEPEVAAIDASSFYASAAISLKRQADAADRQAGALETIAKWCENNWVLLE